MNINFQQNQPTFSAKFVNNAAFKDVVRYAKETKQLEVLDAALNKLDGANPGNIMIIQGKNPSGVGFSSFMLGNKSVPNLGTENPAKASFDGILDLSEFGKKFHKLFSGNMKSTLTENKIIEKYSVK